MTVKKVIRAVVLNPILQLSFFGWLAVRIAEICDALNDPQAPDLEPFCACKEFSEYGRRCHFAHPAPRPVTHRPISGVA